MAISSKYSLWYNNIIVQKFCIFTSTESADDGTERLLKDIAGAIERLPKQDLCDEESITDSFLLVFQTSQQQKWLLKYGNTITCMDAIYKTTRYTYIVNTSY